MNTNNLGFEQLLALPQFTSVMDKKPTSWKRTSTGITFTIGLDCWTKAVSKDGKDWFTLCVVSGEQIAFITLSSSEYQGDIDASADSYEIIALECLVANGNSKIGDICYRAVPA
jgi:hypothetical protein